MQRSRELQVINMKVQAAQHYAHIWIQRTPISECLEVLGGNVPSKIGISAADAGDSFGSEFLFYSGLAKGKDFVLARGELENS